MRAAGEIRPAARQDLAMLERDVKAAVGRTFEQEHSAYRIFG
jgi:hypothetical protein